MWSVSYLYAPFCLAETQIRIIFIDNEIIYQVPLQICSEIKVKKVKLTVVTSLYISGLVWSEYDPSCDIYTC